MTTFTVKIVGVDTYMYEQPLLADLLATSGVASVDLECTAVNLVPEMDSETVEYMNDINIANNKIRMAGELVVDYKTLPTTGVSFTNYYQFASVLLRRYTYIYSADYHLELSVIAALNKALRVNITGVSIDVEANGFIKYANIPFVAGDTV